MDPVEQDQVTTVLPRPTVVAVNCCVPFGAIVAVTGERLTPGAITVITVEAALDESWLGV
jgi:hypothetical protein